MRELAPLTQKLLLKNNERAIFINLAYNYFNCVILGIVRERKDVFHFLGVVAERED